MTTSPAPAPNPSRDATGEAGQGRRPRSKVDILLETIRFEHTVFELPFAYVGMILAADGAPTFWQFAWITVAMASARTFAMTANRLIDARNPRTAGRALPEGLLSVRVMTVAAFASAVTLTIATWSLNDTCLTLMLGAVVILTLYLCARRVTWACHFVLGLAIGLAPVGAWVGVRGTVDTEPLVLFLAVVFWVAGFDIVCATQDIEVNRREGLHSIPARFGVTTAFRIARASHAMSVACLVALGVVAGLGVPYYVGVAGAAGLLVFEHSVDSPRDLSKVNVAFLNVNGYLAVSMLVMTIADYLAGWITHGWVGA
jgi:4-hydroxybenzoate polyprenyltransferase